MGEFIVAHKLALLLIGVALGSFVLLTRRNNSADATTYPNGVPVNPYAANSPAGGFSLSDLLPAGPAGPVLDPAIQNPGPVAGEAPAAVDNAPATPSGSNGIPALAGTSFSDTPYDQLPTSIQEGLAYGYPIQPDGSVLASDVHSPEPIPANSTFGNGRTLEHMGVGTSPTMSLPVQQAPQPVYDLSSGTAVQVGDTSNMPIVPTGKVYAT